MIRWPLNFTSASTTTTTPSASVDTGEILPDYYRFLDPLFSNRKLKPLDNFAPESYRDDEGHVYHSTYRFFPTTVPRNKRLPTEERPTYVQRFWDRVPEPEFRVPSQLSFNDTSGQTREATEDVPHERTGLLSRRLRGGLGNKSVDDDGRDGLLIKIKKLFQFFMVFLRHCFRDEPGASIV